MKGVNENRYLLHAVLREIQELSPVTSAESVTSTTRIRNLIRPMMVMEWVAAPGGSPPQQRARGRCCAAYSSMIITIASITALSRDPLETSFLLTWGWWQARRPRGHRK